MIPYAFPGLLSPIQLRAESAGAVLEYSSLQDMSSSEMSVGQEP